MKLGVTTLGCPAWTLDEILTRLPSCGYEGVELRGLGPDLDLAQSPGFSTAVALTRTKQSFQDAGLEICGLDTSCTFVDPDHETRRWNEDQGRAAIDMAAALGAPWVRVFGGSIGEGGNRTAAVGYVAESLRALGDYADSVGGAVSVVLETHDSFSTGAQAAEALHLAAHPRVQALWDLHHPFRNGEAPAETFAAIGAYVKLTHVKDSKPGGTYCLLGEGDVPIREMLRLLKKSNYDGWINLEWEKRWIPELADPEIAFPQYASKLREYLKDL